MKKKLDVVAAFITNDKGVLLCQRKENDCYGNLWEFPGGTVETGEELPDAIKREISEELGIKIKVIKLLSNFYDEDKDLIIKVFLFSCSIISGEPNCLDCKDLGFYNTCSIEALSLAPVDKKIFNYLKAKKVIS